MATPFPHIVLDDVLRPEVFEQACAEFARVEDGWANYLHLNERKYANTNPATWEPMLRAIAEAFASQRFLDLLRALTGIEDLRADPELDGGGLHRSLPGGFLNVHADFTAHHTHERWHRRVNLILYLNPEWPSDWGGDLELWSADMKQCEAKVTPKGNRMLLFTTSSTSLHGHPEPLLCPEGSARQSMAIYYFTEEESPPIRSTAYRARPGDGMKAVGFYLDEQALKLYDVLKRRLRISDRTASRVLAGLNRLRRPRSGRDR
jgi:Rps23 Pro-64 3,4-dihydroxylase Tpa1-like proline 4-hydroxylase